MVNKCYRKVEEVAIMGNRIFLDQGHMESFSEKITFGQDRMK